MTAVKHQSAAKRLDESPEITRLKTKLGIDVLWLYVLSLLKEKPSHAYVLRRQIAERFGFTPGNVSAYVVLYKLRSRGYVTGKKTGGGRTVYTITPKGRKLLTTAKEILHETQERLFG